MTKLNRAARLSCPFGAIALGALAFHEVVLAGLLAAGVAALITYATGLDLIEATRPRR